MASPFVACLLALACQDKGPTEKEVDEAIRRGTDCLILHVKAGFAASVPANREMGYDYCALILYALVHSGIDINDPTVKGLHDAVAICKFRRTYQVAMTAAALAAIDPSKYREKLALCAQYLIDWQADNGQWGYSDSYDPPLPKGLPVATGTGQGSRATVAKFPILRADKKGPPVGDNSNSQYAALGLRACGLAGCEIDPATLKKAVEWWEICQQNDGGWSYNQGGQYQAHLGTYGSMTAGAVSSLIMLRQLRGHDPKGGGVGRGISWLGSHFAVDKNPKAPFEREEWHYYYLYALERAGDLYPTERIGGHKWYAEGANYLIKAQKQDGRWEGSRLPEMFIADTCFALLFLERAARRPPVATGGGTQKK